MPAWSLVFTKIATKNLRVLPSKLRRRIAEKLEWFLEHFSEIIQTPLHGQLSGLYKLRIGDIRVIYDIDNQHSMIVVHYINRRDRVYKTR